MSNVVALPLGKPAQPKTSFDDFWAVYPRKESKGTARAAWHRALKLASAPEIIAAAAEYAKRAQKPFICLPATWLNGERWADEYEVGAPAPMVTSEEERLRHLATRWFTCPQTPFTREYRQNRISEADKRQMVALGLITKEMGL